MRGSFDGGRLNERGTAVALYDYAFYAHALLGVEPVILHDASGTVDDEQLSRFSSAFAVRPYRSPEQRAEALEEERVDVAYFLKTGRALYPTSPGRRTAVHEVSRVAAVSAAGTFARGDRRLSLGYRMLVATTMRSVYDALEAMEMRIMASALEWTIVRPVGLSDAPASGEYRLSLDGSLLAKASRISREDVASLVVKALETDLYVRRAVVIAG